MVWPQKLKTDKRHMKRPYVARKTIGCGGLSNWGMMFTATFTLKRP